jgi:hypothetical protein
MSKDEALKLALEVMRNQGDVGVDEWIAAEAAIKQALAAPVQEPVAWMHKETGLLRQANKAKGGDFEPNHWTPLYTTPPAQPAVQEPFGYLEIDDIESQREYPNNCRNVNLWHEGGEGMVAIYTTPPAAQRKWVGLTDEERGKVYADWRWSDGRTSNLALCEHIEAKLKEKNNG